MNRLDDFLTQLRRSRERWPDLTWLDGLMYLLAALGLFLEESPPPLTYIGYAFLLGAVILFVAVMRGHSARYRFWGMLAMIAVGIVGLTALRKYQEAAWIIVAGISQWLYHNVLHQEKPPKHDVEVQEDGK